MASRISLKSGTEGPKHDPYGYEEVTVQTPSGPMTCHIGLAVWIKDNGIRLTQINERNYDEVFKMLTGDTATNWIEKYIEEHRDDVEDPMGSLADYE